MLPALCSSEGAPCRTAASACAMHGVHCAFCFSNIAAPASERLQALLAPISKHALSVLESMQLVHPVALGYPEATQLVRSSLQSAQSIQVARGHQVAARRIERMEGIVLRQVEEHAVPLIQEMAARQAARQQEAAAQANL